MSLSDPIADFLTRIRNAHMGTLATVEAPYSRMKEEIARILKQEGYIKSYARADDAQGHPVLKLTLKYHREREPAIQGLRRVSSPGLRQYVGAKEVPRVLDGLGIAILSTSVGIMPDAEARAKGIGGEVLCTIW